ncbi:MAG: molybdopterin molybdotransferase MoeA [Planctomycetota bacterium]|jgi:molybdopterin molybdotransferase
MQLPILDGITAKIDAVRQRLRINSADALPIHDCSGRILAERVVSFRDSPAVDVSAMDGYAIRIMDLRHGPLPVDGVASAGAVPLECPPGKAIRIFTGGAVPKGADCVVPREQCIEEVARVQINTPLESLRVGQNIRRQGENAPRGSVILAPGTLLHGPAISALVSLSEGEHVSVYDPVRVSILNTGDELVEAGQPIRDWQIRDSNGPLLSTMLGSIPWIRASRTKIPDDPAQIRSALAIALEESDAVILTGGVSMGDTDHVPRSVVDCGGDVVFHRIPIRPGKPLLGAVGPQGQLVMGLPGNPVSVAVTFRRYALNLLRHVAGMAEATEVPLRVPVQCEDTKTLELLWFRLVQLQSSGTASVLPSQGSGDIIALAQSDGFVEIPPGVPSQGSFPFFPWPSGSGLS